MHCSNRNHHVENGQECFMNDTGHDNKENQKEAYSPCSMHRSNYVGHPQNVNPHDMHWRINKNSFKGWGLNFVYFALHAVQIYLVLRLVR